MDTPESPLVLSAPELIRLCGTWKSAIMGVAGFLSLPSDARPVVPRNAPSFLSIQTFL